MPERTCFCGMPKSSMFAEMPLDNRTVVKFAAVAAIAGSFVTLNPRYVNMTDINFSRPSGDPDSKGAEGAGASPRTGGFRWDIIELLFFAYRDFVGDADHE